MEAKSQFEKKPLATARGFFLPALAVGSKHAGKNIFRNYLTTRNFGVSLLHKQNSL
jgi:hypothetical protein